jgi:transposase
MDLAKYCVNAVLVEGRSMRAVAAATGRSKSWVQRHVALFQAGGEEALVPRKRGPRVPANLTSAAWEDEIVAWRKRLAADGLDAGDRTIHWHLSQSSSSVPRQVPRCFRHPDSATDALVPHGYNPVSVLITHGRKRLRTALGSDVPASTRRASLIICSYSVK